MEQHLLKTWKVTLDQVLPCPRKVIYIMRVKERPAYFDTTKLNKNHNKKKTLTNFMILLRPAKIMKFCKFHAFVIQESVLKASKSKKIIDVLSFVLKVLASLNTLFAIISAEF